MYTSDTQCFLYVMTACEYESLFLVKILKGITWVNRVGKLACTGIYTDIIHITFVYTMNITYETNLYV